MQPKNPLIAVGISVVIAASWPKAASAQENHSVTATDPTTSGQSDRNSVVNGFKDRSPAAGYPEEGKPLTSTNPDQTIGTTQPDKPGFLEVQTTKPRVPSSAPIAVSVESTVEPRDSRQPVQAIADTETAPVSRGLELQAQAEGSANEETNPVGVEETDLPELANLRQQRQDETAQQAPPSTETSPAQPEPPTPTAPATPENAVPTEPESPRRNRQRRNRRNQPADNRETAPEYLDQDANPLSFPTRPEEVEVVGTQPITLQQAVQLSIRNNRELQRAQLELEQQRAQLAEARAENFPTLGARAGLVFQGQEQAQREGAAFGQQGGDITRTTIENTALSGTLEANYDLYTSGRRAAAIRSAEGQVRFQELQVEATTEDLIQQVATDYFDLQQADEQVRIQRDAVAQAEQSLRDTEALERAGVGTRFDVLQSQVELANTRQELTRQLSQQEVARRQLVERLNLSQAVNVSAADPIEVGGIWELTLEETIVAAFRNRAELEQQLVQREIAQANRRQALAQLGPQVSLGAAYGVQNTLSATGDGAAEDAGFLSNFQVSLNATLQLFDGGRARAQARQQERNIEIAETEFANQRDQIRFNVEQAYSTLQASFENIQTTSLAVQQAQEALRLARLRFQAGVGTQTDVLRQQTELTRAEVNRLTAILDYNRSLIALQRQVSNFPEGFIGDTP
jgi:outer membrane protein TolC